MRAPDGALRTAANAAAHHLRISGPLPARSEDVLRSVMVQELRTTGAVDIEVEGSGITCGWSPLPGGLDLFAGAKPHRWAAELKVWDIGQQIWDAIKLASGLACGDLTDAYLISVAPSLAFGASPGKELFSSRSDEHRVAALIERNPRQWQHELSGGSGRPTNPPARFNTQLLERKSTWYGHEIRLVRLTLSTQDTVRFENGWPVCVDPEAALELDAGSGRKGVSIPLGGLEVPPRFSASWWEQSRSACSPAEYESLYGALLLRGWSDTEIWSRVSPPAGCTPPWEAP